MRRRRVIWSDTARDEYLDTVRYIAERNPDAAERVAERIGEAAAKLADFATGRPGRVDGTYEKVVVGQPHILAYEILQLPEGDEAIAILHVIHGARDWPEGSWPAG